MFVTLPVACEGGSVNGRNYTAANIASIAEQCLMFVGGDEPPSILADIHAGARPGAKVTDVKKLQTVHP